MINNLYIRKTLNEDQIKRVSDLYPHLAWEDGKVSSDVVGKVNRQALSKGFAFEEIDDMIVKSLCNDRDYDYFYCPKSTTYSIISETSVGGKYPLHTDHSTLGHYSTTTFLNEPDEYEGGELFLYVNGSTEKVKLAAGYSVTYITGTPHEVRPVLSGTRLVAVNWTTSIFNSIDQRDIYGDMLRCYDQVKEKPTEGDFDYNNPKFILNELMEKFKRMHL